MGENLEKVKAIHAVLLGDDGRIGDDPERAELIAEHLREAAEPEFECVMAGPDPSFRTTTRGPEGFLSAWADWVSAFDEFRIEVEELFDAGDRVLDYVRQTARTSRGGVPIETEGGAVWFFRGGLLHRVEFHLDRKLARRSAGLGGD